MERPPFKNEAFDEEHKSRNRPKKRKTRGVLMEWGIVVDSCCDVTPQFIEEYGIIPAPLTMALGNTNFSDDLNLDMPSFMEAMKNYKDKISTAAPAPMLFKDAFLKFCKSFAVTLSSNLSGSYANALIGMEMAQAEGAEAHVFDSKSASAGEVLIALKIRELIRSGLQKSAIIEVVDAFIQKMKTYFVIENIDNLMKNGRMNKVTGKIITILGVKPIMGSDGDGNIALFSHARSETQVIEKLVNTIQQSGRDVEGSYMVITHCNNKGLAEKLKERINQKYRFTDILIIPTRGISSVYVNDKGLIMAF